MVDRASDVRQAVIDAIEGATVDTKASSTDVFRVLRQTREPTSVQERVFMVRLIQGPDKTEENTCDAFVVTYQVVGFYSTSKDVEDRIASDNERLYHPLWNLTSTTGIENSTVGPTYIEEGDNMIAARRDVAILYRLNSGLL